MYFGESKANVNPESLNNPNKTKYEIHKTIGSALKYSTTFTQLEELLGQRGIRVKYKYKGQTDQIQGISFEKDSLSFKGSEIDRKFSYMNLNKTLQKNLTHQTAKTQEKENTFTWPERKRFAKKNKGRRL